MAEGDVPERSQPAAGTVVTEEDRKGREGARWINQRPTPQEFAAWAKDNIKVDDALEIDDYLGGIVLIPAVDKKAKYVMGWKDGRPTLGEREEMAFVPYAKVETRLQYLWDLVDAHSEDGWTVVIEPLETPRPELEMVSEIQHVEATDTEAPFDRTLYRASPTSAIVHQLPPGFFLMPVPIGDAYSYSLCCSYRVAIYKKDQERPLREGRGTKQVALVGKKYRDAPLEVDENAIMKAETGAIGRALGAAGVFTIPGSGIATAEDMLDAAAGVPPAPVTEPGAGAGPASPSEPPAPRAEAAEDVLAACTAIVRQLQEDFPDAYDSFGRWCQARRPKITNLSSLAPEALKGVKIKLEKLLSDAKARQEARGEAEAAPEAAEPVAEPPPAPAAPGEDHDLV